MTTLEKNIRNTIKKMKADGSVGASAECIKQNTSTKGLVCSVSEYNREFDRLIKTIKVPNFLIY